MGGEQLEGDIFLSPSSRFRSTPQGPAEFLNEAEELFPLALPDGGTSLVAKSRVESVVALPDDGVDTDHDEAVVPHPVSVELKLASGSIVRGTVSIDAPPNHARLLDFLNTTHERFLRVADAGRIILVNRQAIAHVHEQS